MVAYSAGPTVVDLVVKLVSATLPDSSTSHTATATVQPQCVSAIFVTQSL